MRLGPNLRVYDEMCWLPLLNAPLPQALGGDSPTPEAARAAADSDDEMGRELFGDDEADASDREEGVSAQAPAAAALAEPPAPSATVRNIQMPCTAELVSVPLLCFVSVQADNKQAPATSCTFTAVFVVHTQT